MSRITTAFLLIALAACVPPPRVALPAPFTASGLNIAVEGLYSSGSTVVGVQGIAENASGRDLRSCFVSFDLVDAAGVKVGDAIASTAGLTVGQKWRFQAIFTTPFHTSFQALRAGRVQCF